MGTHSIVRFKDSKGQVRVAIYQQYDGYLDGVGLDLAQFLSRIVLVNGIPGTKLEGDKVYGNGLGCIAAQYIAAKKEGPGNLYITVNDCDDEAYNYDVTIDDEEGTIKMKETRSPGSPCTPAEFVKNIEKHGGY